MFMKLSIRKCFQGDLVTMKWPPQSPDLNPIEQIWDYMDTKLQKEKRTSANHMWASLQSIWNEITPETLDLYISNMPKRCRAVIDAKGGHTKY